METENDTNPKHFSTMKAKEQHGSQRQSINND